LIKEIKKYTPINVIIIPGSPKLKRKSNGVPTSGKSKSLNNKPNPKKMEYTYNRLKSKK
jgi:hypothetical protein